MLDVERMAREAGFAIWTPAPTKALAAAVLEHAATIADELRENYSAIKDAALLNGDVALSNAASGEPRACEAIASILRTAAAELVSPRAKST